MKIERPTMLSVLTGTLLLASGFAPAADQVRAQDQVQAQDQTRAQDRVQAHDQAPIYGSQMMTQKERAEYSNKMRAAKTSEERENVRKEHHEQMVLRAKERGVTLPAEAPARGGGMGPGGGGMGPGGGGRGR